MKTLVETFKEAGAAILTENPDFRLFSDTEDTSKFRALVNSYINCLWASNIGLTPMDLELVMTMVLMGLDAIVGAALVKAEANTLSIQERSGITPIIKSHRARAGGL